MNSVENVKRRGRPSKQTNFSEDEESLLQKLLQKKQKQNEIMKQRYHIKKEKEMTKPETLSKIKELINRYERKDKIEKETESQTGVYDFKPILMAQVEKQRMSNMSSEEKEKIKLAFQMLKIEERKEKNREKYRAKKLQMKETVRQVEKPIENSSEIAQSKNENSDEELF